MVGMPNVMMWYAPGGTWNIGKRDELGQNRGWYQAVSKAISPEGILNWQVWDGSNRKWEKAHELKAMSVGSKRVAFTGVTPRMLQHEHLSEFVRRGYQFHEGRAVYECVDNPERSMWFCEGHWHVGSSAEIGTANGWLLADDDAACPELVRQCWQVREAIDPRCLIDAPEVLCMAVGAMTVMVAGETPNQLNNDKLGEFVRQAGKAVNSRPIYSQVGNENRMIWYTGGFWYLGRKDELGKSQGWLCVRDPAPAPELTQSMWHVGDGETLHAAPNIKCAAIGARCIEVLGEPVSNLHKDKMGEFKMLAAQEVNGKPVYEKDPSLSHMVWAANGYWYVGKRDELGKQAGWMQESLSHAASHTQVSHTPPPPPPPHVDHISSSPDGPFSPCISAMLCPIQRGHVSRPISGTRHTHTQHPSPSPRTVSSIRPSPGARLIVSPRGDLRHLADLEPV